MLYIYSQQSRHLLFCLLITAIFITTGGCSPEAVPSPKHEEPDKSQGSTRNNKLWLPTLDEQTQQVIGASKTLILVISKDWDNPHGLLFLFSKAKDKNIFEQKLGPLPVNLGTKGLSWGIGLTSPPKSGPIKQEGDLTGPAGIFEVGPVFGDAPKPPKWLKIPYQQVTDRSRCVDDPKAKDYNKIVHLDDGKIPEFDSAEELAGWGLFLTVNHNHIIGNKTPVPYSGSCIFFHEWSGPKGSTLGCTSLSEEHLKQLLANITKPGLKTLLIQLPQPEYEQAIIKWDLPKVTLDQ